MKTKHDWAPPRKPDPAPQKSQRNLAALLAFTASNMRERVGSRMPHRWKRTFKPIALKDGRTIKTLDDARRLMLALPERHQSRPPWQYAAELLLAAAGRQEKYSTMDARAQLARALIVEGLL